MHRHSTQHMHGKSLEEIDGIYWHRGELAKHIGKWNDKW